jgi:C1A family cysteine protease
LIILPSLAVSVHAASAPDLTVDSIWLEDASQIGQPTSQVSPGQSFNIVATIKNIGQDTASGYYLDVYYDSDYGRGGPDNIAPGEVQTWYVGPLTAQAGTHTTKWVVDPDNLIVELDESNNQKEYTFNSTQALGWLPENIPANARVTPVVSAALPTHFDWTQKDGQNWMTSVKNQEGCGSCVAFAAVGALEGQLKVQANNPSWNIDLSEQHLFSCGGGTCSGGWYISSALNYLQQYGTPDEACSPYQGGSGSCSNSCPDWQSQAFKISSWSWVANNVGAVEAALMNGPLVAGFTVYADFYYGYNGGVYHWDHVSQPVGGHAVVIVGYDQPAQYWIVKNSWGPNWGENGYFRIGFGEAGIENYVASVTALLTVTNAATKTVTVTQSSTSYLHQTATTTSTSYTSTFTSTSTIPTVTTIALVLSSVTSVIQSIQYLTSILTTTVTSYTGTQTSTSMIVLPTTVTVGPSTSTVQTTQALTSTGTTTVTSYTTATVTSYTGTQTSTSTSLVYTTVTSLASADASSPLTYIGFLSVLAVTVGHRGVASKSRRIRRLTLRRGPLTGSSPCYLSPYFVDHRDTILSRPMWLMEGRCSSN